MLKMPFQEGDAILSQGVVGKSLPQRSSLPSYATITTSRHFEVQ